MDMYDFYPDPENELVKEFLNKFGGYFNMSIHGDVEYIDNDDKIYDYPENVETPGEFYSFLSELIKTGNNGFLKYPKYNTMPKDALI